MRKLLVACHVTLTPFNEIDKLANTTNPTGDPSCPPLLCRAKHIAKDMLAKVNAVIMGYSIEEDVIDFSSASGGREDV